MRNKNTLIAIAALIIAAAALFGFSQSTGDVKMDHQGHMGSSPESEFSSDEVMFAQMMIPHHQQAVTISAFATKNSTNKDVLSLAAQISSEQAPEIEKMKGWLTTAGAALEMDHTMDMGGMLTQKEIDLLSKAKGVKFDRLFLAGMIAHHQGAIQMVKMIENSSNDEVKTFGAAVIESQSKQITIMSDLLKNIT